MSKKKVTTRFHIFDFVPDCPVYRKQRRPTIIQRCEKVKKLKITSTCEVVTRIEESKHNCILRLPCARL